MFTALWLKDTGERVLRTVLQAVIAAAVVAAPFDLTTTKTIVFVAITAALTVLKDALAALVPAVSPASFAPTRAWFVDAFERLAATFLAAFISAILTGGSYDLTTAKQAALAGIAAAVSLLMSLFAAPVRSSVSPASVVTLSPSEYARRD